ncbi:MAG: alanine racemase [Bdellovibrionales bacterium]|nr:alanine racemase [Bdellovibrionales bacterium]
MNPIPLFKERTHHLQKVRNRLLAIAHKNGTPSYVFDKAEARRNIRDFLSAFRKHQKNVSMFYAIKSNPYIGLLRTVVQEGGYLDASSPSELSLAQRAGAERILYTGPAKSEADLSSLLKLRRRVFLHLDSFHELELLGQILRGTRQTYNVGVRVFGTAQAGWSKFGIPLDQLGAFLRKARQYPELSISALQFHMSFNRDSSRYRKTIREIASFLRSESGKDLRGSLRILDIGGGYAPAAFEGVYPWNRSMAIKLSYPTGLLQKILTNKVSPRVLPIHYTPISQLAEEITQTWKKEILPLIPHIEFWTEPGRFVSHSTMHMLLGVADVKRDRHAVITDGGNNMVGYEKHQWQDYTPIFNLTHFSASRETPVLCYGSLCTANDLWGYYIYGKKIEIGDVLVMPFQGAYTNTLAQHFIRHIPPIVDL